MPPTVGWEFSRFFHIFIFQYDPIWKNCGGDFWSYKSQ